MRVQVAGGTSQLEKVQSKWPVEYKKQTAYMLKSRTTHQIENAIRIRFGGLFIDNLMFLLKHHVHKDWSNIIDDLPRKIVEAAAISAGHLTPGQIVRVQELKDVLLLHAFGHLSGCLMNVDK